MKDYHGAPSYFQELMKKEIIGEAFSQRHATFKTFQHSQVFALQADSK